MKRKDLQIDAIMKKKYITKFAWRKIFEFLKQCKDLYVITELKCKRFMEAIYWMARTGAQWRELPEKYGKWNTIFKRANEWSKKNIFEKLLDFCATDSDLEYIIIDSTIVRAHASAAGYGDQTEEGFGRSKGGFSSKIHAKVDALGNLLKVIITAGQRNDVTQADALLENVSSGSYIIADKGYDSEKLRLKILEKDCHSVIPSRSNRKNPFSYDKFIYENRFTVECFFSKAKYFRRIFSRYDKSLRNFKSFIFFVGVIIFLVGINRYNKMKKAISHIRASKEREETIRRRKSFNGV